MPTSVVAARTFPDSLLTHYRQQTDPPADAVLRSVAEQGGPAAVRHLMQWLSTPLDDAVGTQPDVVQEFFRERSALPVWADAARMQRGMRFFQQHAGAIGLILGTYSLPYTYLGANGVQLLWLTERIKTDTARRLQETGEWLFAVMEPRHWSSGQAIHRTLKIRLIHAGARWFAWHSGRWQDEWGPPVNQEDMAGTNLAFSYVVLRGLRAMSITATREEEENFLHHVNVVGWFNGVQEDLLCHNLREAYHLDRAIAARQFRPSDAGRGLTKALLDAIGNVSVSENARNLAAAQMRFFLGQDHADALGIPATGLEQRLVNVVSRLPIFPKLIPIYGV